MAGEQYGDLAVASLLDYLEANLETYLRAVETAQSLDANSLTDPVDYIPADLEYDAVGPNVLVYTTSGSPIDQNNGIYSYDCTVILYFHGDADLEAGQLKTRRYMTALINCIAADRTLGSTVIEAVDQDQSFFADRPSESSTMHALALGIDIAVT